MLIPAPDYPLWTAAVHLSGAQAIHYECDENKDWAPNLDDIRKKITAKTRGIVIINPNNPTGAVYTKQQLIDIIKIAREHNLIIFSDEIYDKILYDDAEFTSIASLADDLMFVTFNGLSKTYRVAGYRTGWMAISGNTKTAAGYIEGLNMIASMRLCSNVPSQFAIQTALGGYQSINELIKGEGRLNQQRMLSYNMINEIPGLSCTLPKGALYSFVKVDQERFNIKNDEQMVLDLLLQQKILVVHGTGFNWPQPDHFRLVYLPEIHILEEAINRMAEFFSDYRQ
jgi:alanine-synthesizing transaminase